MGDLKFTAATVQMNTKMADVDANLDTIEALAAEAAGRGAAIAVFPELATTGYFLGDRTLSMAEPVPGPSSARLGAVAARHSIHLACGLLERDGANIFNSAVLLGPDGGLMGHYRKLHLFSGEKNIYKAGERACLVDTPFGRLALSICYDLIFPEYIRSLVLAGADVLLNCTNWIADDFQRDEWGWGGEQVQALARTRALENGVYVVMADRVGTENGWRSLGHSCIAGPSGKLLSAMGEDAGVAVADIDLDPAHLGRWRSIATYLADRRPELYSSVARRAG